MKIDGLGILAKEIAIVIAFAICMYCGFIYHSGWAFFGAVIAFINIGNYSDFKDED